VSVSVVSATTLHIRTGYGGSAAPPKQPCKHPIELVVPQLPANATLEVLSSSDQTMTLQLSGGSGAILSISKRGLFNLSRSSGKIISQQTALLPVGPAACTTAPSAPETPGPFATKCAAGRASQRWQFNHSGFRTLQSVSAKRCLTAGACKAPGAPGTGVAFYTCVEGLHSGSDCSYDNQHWALNHTAGGEVLLTTPQKMIGGAQCVVAKYSAADRDSTLSLESCTGTCGNGPTCTGRSWKVQASGTGDGSITLRTQVISQGEPLQLCLDAESATPRASERRCATTTRDLQSGEEIFGLGVQSSPATTATAPLGLRGSKRFLETNAVFAADGRSHAVTPFFLSSEGYGIFLPTTAYTAWDVGKTDPDRISFEQAEPFAEYYIFLGPTPLAGKLQVKFVGNLM